MQVSKFAIPTGFFIKHLKFEEKKFSAKNHAYFACLFWVVTMAVCPEDALMK